jgi:hypothetical protein
MELSATRYCPVIAMRGKVAEVITSFQVEEETEFDGRNELTVEK